MIFLSFISVCPLKFNKLGRIKSVHQVFILKHISHLVADYTCTTNHCVDVGMRMPLNPGIDPAAGNQVSVLTGKGAVQYGTLMMRCHYLECRQMVCNHNDMCRRTLFDTFPDKADAGIMHPVEFLHLQQLPVELDLAEVIHAFPHEIPVVRADP